MSSPTQGTWACSHNVDGRDFCPECCAPEKHCTPGEGDRTYGLMVNNAMIVLEDGDNISADLEPVSRARYLIGQALKAAGADAHVRILTWDGDGREITGQLAADVIGDGDPFVTRYGDPWWGSKNQDKQG
jgi:hypothetical protein